MLSLRLECSLFPKSIAITR